MSFRMLKTVFIFSLLAACTSAREPQVQSTAEKAVTESTTPVCIVGGCSNEKCLAESEAQGLMGTCEWKEEYRCRQLSKCEAQSNGQCGFTETEASKKCMNELPKDSGPATM